VKYGLIGFWFWAWIECECECEVLFILGLGFGLNEMDFRLGYEESGSMFKNSGWALAHFNLKPGRVSLKDRVGSG
jgi:hypothetical protein